jgi:hypothetical protein
LKKKKQKDEFEENIWMKFERVAAALCLYSLTYLYLHNGYCSLDLGLMYWAGPYSLVMWASVN